MVVRGLAKGPVRPRPTCGRLLYAATLPFLAAVLVGAALFNGRSGSLAAIVRQPSRVVLENPPCTGPECSGREDGVQLAAAGSSAGLAGGADDGDAPPAGELPPLFMFIGILSGRGYRHRRLAVREAWSNRAQVEGLVVSKFILSEDERTPQVQKEMEQFNDIVFVKEKTNYKSILYKTFFVLEYAVTHYDAKFVLKTDDDAFINVNPIIEQLQMLCENPDCVRERLYIGKMAKHSEVLLTPGHKWNNAIFHNHTGLKVYPNYMMGGGYIISGEVSRVLVDVHSRMHLKFTPIEDATLGFWLMAMDLRHVDHPKFYTWAAPCCFVAPVRKQGQRLVTRFQLAEEFESDLCSLDPWLVLHKIDSPTKMRYVGAKVANCSSTRDPALAGLAPSIEPYLPPHKQAMYQEALQKIKAQRQQEQRVAVVPQAPPQEAGVQQQTGTLQQQPADPQQPVVSQQQPQAVVQPVQLPVQQAQAAVEQQPQALPQVQQAVELQQQQQAIPQQQQAQLSEQQQPQATAQQQPQAVDQQQQQQQLPTTALQASGEGTAAASGGQAVAASAA